MTLPRLGPSSEALLRFICTEVEAGRAFPTPSECSEAMGWRRASSAADALLRLTGAGRLVVVNRTAVQGGVARTFALPEPGAAAWYNPTAAAIADARRRGRQASAVARATKSRGETRRD